MAKDAARKDRRKGWNCVVDLKILSLFPHHNTLKRVIYKIVPSFWRGGNRKFYSWNVFIVSSSLTTNGDSEQQWLAYIILNREWSGLFSDLVSDHLQIYLLKAKCDGSSLPRGQTEWLHWVHGQKTTKEHVELIMRCHINLFTMVTFIWNDFTTVGSNVTSAEIGISRTN